MDTLQQQEGAGQQQGQGQWQPLQHLLIFINTSCILGSVTLINESPLSINVDFMNLQTSLT